MKHLITYISLITALLLTGCAGEDFVDDATYWDIATTESTEDVCASLPEMLYDNIGGSMASRSTLIYDYSTAKMRFAWGKVGEDNMGVFPYVSDKDVTPKEFVLKTITNENATNGNFRPESGSFKPKTDGTRYVAFRPYIDEDFDYTAKPISYEGQSNGNNAKMGLYYKTYFGTEPKDYTEYNQSEAAASAHLSDYDFLVSQPQTTSDNGNIFFPLQRVGAVVRFFIKNPAKEVFEQLQLVTRGAPEFTLEGTVDISSLTINGTQPHFDITTTKKSNVMVLEYGENGIDMTNPSNEDNDYYYTNNGTQAGFMISYMMLAPVDLRSATSINLYLVSHVKGEPQTKKYYKSSDLAKPNLTSNKFYQWRPASYADAPIEFESVTVQEWQEGTTLSNGSGGTGTAGW